VDQGTRTGGPAVDEHHRTPEEIRQDIARTREELGDTVEALASKTDVKGQARAKVEGARAAAADHPVPLAVLGVLVVGAVIGRIIGTRRS
jgi:hypothetical protein